MTPEEKFNLHIWWLLKRIKEEWLATPSSSPVEFNTGNVEYIDKTIPSIYTRNKLMFKLQELGAIKVLEEPQFVLGTGTIFYIKIIELKFNKIYNLYQKKTYADIDYGQECLKISSVQTPDQHRLFRDKWLSIKLVFDVIAKHIPILSKAQEIIFIPRSQFYENHLKDDSIIDTLMFLSQLEIIESQNQKDERDIVEDTQRAVERLCKGNKIIIPLNIEPFEIHHSKISELYAFIEQDGYKRFPAAYRLDEQTIKAGKMLNELETNIKERAKKDEQNTFKIQVRDRYIWVNKYLLSKPHAVGSNLEFFEYVRSQPMNTKIERKNLPSQSGKSSLKSQVKNKGFTKILNELGFKGEILKAFFPKRGKNIVVYKGDRIAKKDIEKSGIKIPLFLKELELAHTKNSPE